MCLAIPTQVLEIDEGRVATVELGGVKRQVSLIMTPEAEVGDYVLLHAGYAITLMDPEEAQASLEAFAELAEIQESLDREAMRESADPTKTSDTAA